MFFAVAAALAMVAGVMTWGAQRSAGEAAKKSGEYQQTLADRSAAAMEIRANQERASGQRAGIEERRQGAYVRSAAIARAGASGAGVSDPSIERGLGDIGTAVDYRALTALYQGEEAGRGLEYGAVLERAGGAGEAYAGKVQQRLMNAQANISLLQGAAGAAGFLHAGGFGAGSTLADTGGTSLNAKYASPARPHGVSYRSPTQLAYR